MAKIHGSLTSRLTFLKLPKDDDMNYTGYPRFGTAPLDSARTYQVTRLAGVTPAAFHFSISDTVMPGAELEHDEAVDAVA